MTRSRQTSRLGRLTLGTVPRVVGTISMPEFKFSAGTASRACDIAELRVDLLDVSDWLQRGQRIESAGTPVIVTPRLKVEGGSWQNDDRSRLTIYKTALSHLAAVDVELRSDIVEEVAAMAAKARKCCIISYHDFVATPSLAELKRVATKAQSLGSVVKIVTTLQTEDDLDTLWQLLECKWKKPVCIMGMGPIGRETRLVFPISGSCLTYGYLDKSAAPGQLSASKLVERLRRLLPAYDKSRASR